MRPFTGNGDYGHSSTAKISSIPKYHELFEILGQLDTLNAHIGVARSMLASETKWLDLILYRLQNELFEIGAALNLEDNSFPIDIALIDMESTLIELHQPLPELKHFILPGGTPLSAYIHICRTSARNLERHYSAYFLKNPSFDETYLATLMKYLNRLSSLFFTMARKVNLEANVPDVIWRPKSKD